MFSILYKITERKCIKATCKKRIKNRCLQTNFLESNPSMCLNIWHLHLELNYIALLWGEQSVYENFGCYTFSWTVKGKMNLFLPNSATMEKKSLCSVLFLSVIIWCGLTKSYGKCIELRGDEITLVSRKTGQIRAVSPTSICKGSHTVQCTSGKTIGRQHKKQKSKDQTEDLTLV